ncbi:hypothetical protein [Nocardiopsis algeriensis]|uniref:Uncharacterized protein n=1 Tax=Nocardiopsis algeriensis TaxID=1478215 RepID=A0A841IVI5_9ACTN|nr:hypothetical protein [Nocardiopsis algeriensis]MBB6122182.1 hypothetical protein [Nocardiopsis algeriensis]
MTETASTAPLYRNGSWEETTDVVSTLWDENQDQDYDVVLRRAGFAPSPWTQVGNTDFTLPLALVVYARHGGEEPAFLVEVNPSSSFVHHVYAHQVHDVMDLITRWGPALQAGAVTEAVQQLFQSGPEDQDKSQLVRSLERIARG